ncbi:delta 1-pyrroline-5-carboxylate reductase [Mortierella claussenii]|nr:delta 1-pyrroline-5-carboxylate reductase [Mortierella claussenii]
MATAAAAATAAATAAAGPTPAAQGHQDSQDDDPLHPAGFIACVSHEESAQKLVKALGHHEVKVLHGAKGNVQGVTEADVVLLCTKPQVAKAVLSAPGIQEALTDKLLVSICAGVTIEQLQSWTTPTTTVIRAMPNTPCKIREGMTVLSCGPNTDIQFMNFTSKIFSTLGRCRILDEKHLDAVTALAGSGPAFACVMLEALADGGVMMGLPRDVATELAAQVLQGAARMVLTTGAHPAAIKDSVTTPGGCTIAGLLTMEDGKIRSTLARTIQEAATVASTLGRDKKEQIKDRILGCVFGAAVGDAYGLATEFMSKKSARERYGNGPIAFGLDPGYPVWIDYHRSKWARNDFTDDTDQMLLLLQSLQQTQDGKLHAVNFANRLKEWSVIGFPELNTPPRGIGYTVGSTLTHPEFRYNPHKAAFDIWNSKGRTLAANGAVMRTAVLGVESFWDEERVVENALAAAKVTHADPRSVVSAVAASVLISRLLRGGGNDAAQDATCRWNPRLSEQRYKQNILGYLRRGTDIGGEQSSEPTYDPETTRSAYKNKDEKAIAKARAQTVSDLASEPSTAPRSFKVGVMDKITQFIVGPPKGPRTSDDWNVDRPPVVLRDDICWVGIDNVGEHGPMTALAKSVIRDYKFLLLETDVVPPTIRIRSGVQEGSLLGGDYPTAPIAVQEKWAQELENSCFPKALAQLELGDAATMGYTYKCVGVAYYAATRQEDPAPTDNAYNGSAGLFRGILEQVTLEAGDADTNGAVVGSLLGARFGLQEGIPRSWWTELRHCEWLNKEVDLFAERVLNMYDEHEQQQQRGH